MTADLGSINLDPTAQQIDILAVVDTEYIKTRYPNPSKQPGAPTAIDHRAVRLLYTGARGGAIGNGAAESRLTLLPGDTVSLRAVSLYGNADEAVLVYQVSHLFGQQVFNQFTQDFLEVTAVQLNPETSDGLPPLKKSHTFVSIGAKARTSGIETLGACFGLYTLERSTQELVGYYWWDWFVMCS
ncbi:inclusion body family protein [Burkholderia seminalis]|uniref:inclusion body family protein n=1 Tax=Burkholderia seminalis TaxID=488731 RepID=UPI001CF13F6F|nr:inclusion body family protein [Burkholderia seminalis]MCA8302247.1 inclusion body family protein [Burkholderia seminalis]